MSAEAPDLDGYRLASQLREVWRVVLVHVRISFEERKISAPYLGTQTTVLAIVQRAEAPSERDWLQVGLSPRRPYSIQDLTQILKDLPDPFEVELPDDIFDLEMRAMGTHLVKRVIREELKRRTTETVEDDLPASEERESKSANR
ncbi:MAG TPA: hypothetical protein VFQ54_06195 [Thermomicrobiales bacterium]|nr:hypothetical protein [Thermomicrobiales bacterium]